MKTPENEQHPHPALEYPLLYHTLKRISPAALEMTRSFYAKRWAILNPLQRNVPFSKTFLDIGLQLTWGELLIILPLFAGIVTGIIFAVRFPSIRGTGEVARYALIASMVLAQRNSLVTLLFGIPVDRALNYHKLAGKLAGFAGLVHTATFFMDPEVHSIHKSDLLLGAFTGQVNISGSVMMLLLVAIFVSSIQKVRRRLFEAFYYLHLVFIVGLVVGAFFHSGMLLPSVALATWGFDLVIRKVFMARIQNPRSGQLTVISDTVVQVSFSKTESFAYNPGQYIYLAVPEISCQWHPFSISSAPHQKNVTLHIRKAGDWTSALFSLAAKKTDIAMLVEGPFGNLSVNIFCDDYKSVMLISGGIGGTFGRGSCVFILSIIYRTNLLRYFQRSVTPMQSIYDQLVHEAAEKRRDLRLIKFIWIERDPVLIGESEFVQETESDGPSKVVCWDERSLADDLGSISSRLLATFSPVKTEDGHLEDEYSEDFNSTSTDEEDGYSEDCSSIGYDQEQPLSQYKAVSVSPPGTIRDVQIYLTGGQQTAGDRPVPSCVTMGRPNIKKLFLEMRNEAMAAGETKVAICVSAPRNIMNLARQACVMYSDDSLRFDLHFYSSAA